MNKRSSNVMHSGCNCSYACDDFIVNDTNDTKLDRMRGVISKHQETNIGSGNQVSLSEFFKVFNWVEGVSKIVYIL